MCMHVSVVSWWHQLLDQWGQTGPPGSSPGWERIQGLDSACKRKGFGEPHSGGTGLRNKLQRQTGSWERGRQRQRERDGERLSAGSLPGGCLPGGLGQIPVELSWAFQGCPFRVLVLMSAMASLVRFGCLSAPAAEACMYLVQANPRPGPLVRPPVRGSNLHD